MLGALYALVTAPTAITVNSQQGLVQLKGAVTLVVQKSPSGWRIIHEHYSTQVAGN